MKLFYLISISFLSILSITIEANTDEYLSNNLYEINVEVEPDKLKKLQGLALCINDRCKNIWLKKDDAKLCDLKCDFGIFYINNVNSFDVKMWHVTKVNKRIPRRIVGFDECSLDKECSNENYKVNISITNKNFDGTINLNKFFNRGKPIGTR
ncbi:MAG: hypothetical protein HRU20_16095 [Pseudomonadales bacterium]|nr:hypothetical protein [Pseudomonadales bacterium]